MDREAILEKVLEIISDTLELDEDIVLDEESNFKDLGADSFDLLELVTSFEDEFDLTIDDDALEHIASVKDAVDALLAAN